MSSRAPYNGTSRKLLLAFDVGTTFSGISYSILDPGQIPEIKGVTRYPAQENVGGDSKIPTVIYYDQLGAVRAVGAETIGEAIQEKADEEGWTKAEWFKLHLRPKSLPGSNITDSIPALPKNKLAIDVFADFLQYLFKCARTYVEDTHGSGTALWRSVEKQITFVLTHPNGWEGAQQNQMRRAAVIAGLIPDDAEGHSRLSFVTEGEASLHYCIQSGLNTDAIKNGDGILIVDAGGGTIDVSAYGPTAKSSSSMISFQEIAAPQCYLHGSVFVTQEARKFLEGLLRGSRFFDDVPHITNCFDKSTKLRFGNSNDPQYIKFGSARDKDAKLGIRSGQLRLQGSDVASFFEPSVKCILSAIKEQRETSKATISSVYLVGGFAASNWLFSKLKETLEPLGLNFCRPDSHVNKAVADGAVSFYLDHFVSARISKFAYGIECNVPFHESDPELVRRKAQTFEDPGGEIRVPGYFSVILPKDTQVSETKEFEQHYSQISVWRDFDKVDVPIMCYRGTHRAPQWLDTDPDMYMGLCTVEADTSILNAHLQPRYRGPGKRHPYYKITFSIVLSFGLTELKAQLCWTENGAEKRSPAKIVYDPDEGPVKVLAKT